MVNGDNGDNGDSGDNGGNGDGDGDGDGIGGRHSAVGHRRSAIGGRGLVSWLVVRRSSFVARSDSRSLDARRRSADFRQLHVSKDPNHF